jgi:hypothetical protein
MVNGCPTVGGHGDTTELQGSLSISICVVPHESTSGEMVEIVDNEVKQTSKMIN